MDFGSVFLFSLKFFKPFSLTNSAQTLPTYTFILNQYKGQRMKSRFAKLLLASAICLTTTSALAECNINIENEVINQEEGNYLNSFVGNSQSSILQSAYDNNNCTIIKNFHPYGYIPTVIRDELYFSYKYKDLRTQNTPDEVEHITVIVPNHPTHHVFKYKDANDEYITTPPFN